jgi:hypothetical protein
MKSAPRIALVLLAVFALHAGGSVAQVETVPINHPVYTFLKRMELKGHIDRYRSVVLPLSRSQVASFLSSARDHQADLTTTEWEILGDLLVEFSYDMGGGLSDSFSMFGSPQASVPEIAGGLLSDKQKYLYAYSDSNVSFFIDGLLTLDARRSTGDALKGANAEFAQFGGRIRGSIYERMGYYLQATNASVYGNAKVLARDRYIGQAYVLSGGKNFDLAEGYVRYEDRILGVQVGRERLLWGTGYGDRLILTDNVRVYDFIRADAEYKSLKYTFLHAWLLGRRSSILFSLPFDTTYRFVEPVNADKYFAAHRLEFSFPGLFTVGFQEMAIYSNRSPDLAYLNPFTLIESAQRSRDERDNILWAFDARTHFARNVEVHGTVLFDDLNFPKWGTGSVQNKTAFQLGAMTVDPFGLHNTTLFAEYTRVEPYTFSHQRSRDNDYVSGGRLLTHHIGPNADSWFFRIDYHAHRRLFVSASYELQREGDNVYDAVKDTLVKNVGGDVFVPHRGGKDSDIKEFLGGNLVRTSRLHALASYEIVNDVFVDAWYRMTKRKESLRAVDTLDHDLGLALRIDF